jgi:hypothetical protein
MSIVGSDFLGGRLSGNLAFTVNAGASVGDYILVVLYGEGNTAPTIGLPSGEGYVSVGTNPRTNTGTNPDFHCWVYRKLAESGDAGQTHTFTVSASWRAGFMVVISNPDQTTPEDAAPTHSTATTASTSHTAPDITPVQQPHMEIVTDVAFSGTTATPPGGMTEIGEAENIYAAYLYRTSTVAPGTRTVTGANDRYKAIHHLIREASGAPPPATQPTLALLGVGA